MPPSPADPPHSPSPSDGAGGPPRKAPAEFVPIRRAAPPVPTPAPAAAASEPVVPRPAPTPEPTPEPAPIRGPSKLELARDRARQKWARVKPTRENVERLRIRARNRLRDVKDAPAKFVRFRVVRDVLAAFLLVGIVFGGLSLATGGAWPPVIVIESGSMMHPESETPYGRFGSIDVGDMLFVRGFNGDASRIELWVDGGREHYGRPGSVLSYASNGGRAYVTAANETVSNVTVIHRAITYIEVDRDRGGNAVYRMKWLDGEVKEWGPAGIYFPPLGFDERFGYTPLNGYRPAASGFITKGDNAFSNPASDQAIGISAIVNPSWIDGTVHGEIPWLGLGKLALQSGKTNPNVPGWERVGNAFAPIELWSMFFLVLALVILVPFAIDTHRIWRHERERARQLRLDAMDARENRPVEFQTVTQRRSQ